MLPENLKSLSLYCVLLLEHHKNQKWPKTKVGNFLIGLIVGDWKIIQLFGVDRWFAD